MAGAARTDRREELKSIAGNMTAKQSSRVTEFYNNSVILISGATGFMGQVLLEKILRSLKPRKIYLLVRRKRNMGKTERLKELFAGPLFDKVRNSELFLECVVPLEVDFERECLSLDENVRDNLANEVDVAFNLLASVKFTEPLDCALKTNVEYTRRFFTLVSTFHRLKAVIHVSTFYANCDKDVIEEKIYGDIPFGGYENLQRILAGLTPQEKEKLSPHILKQFPNSYTFSKKCTEQMIKDKFSSIPIGIFRPPIVTSIYREPLPGWINNFNGPSGVIAATHQGTLRVLPMDLAKKPYLAPVDYCINGMLICAVDVFRNRIQQVTEIPVYNFVDDQNWQNWGDVCSRMTLGLPFFRRFLFGYMLIVFTRRPIVYNIGYQVMRLQGIIMDVVSTLLGQKGKMRFVMEMVISLIDALKFFCMNDWRMKNPNMRRVVNSLCPEDAAMFPCDLRDVDWVEHLKMIGPGALEYVLRPASSDRSKPTSSISV